MLLCSKCKVLRGMSDSLGGLRQVEVSVLHGPSCRRVFTLGHPPWHLPVQVLDLSGCACVQELPDSLGQLRELKMLNLRHAPSLYCESSFLLPLI